MICFSQHFSGLFTPFTIVDPLRFDRFTTLTWLSIAIIYYFCYCSIAYSPKFHKLSVAHFFNKVTAFHGLKNIALFNGFNSFYHFIRKTIFHNRYALITHKDKKYYNGKVYNLSVWKDESYVTELGISHNCRCYTVQTAADSTSDKNTPNTSPKDVKPEFRKNVGKTGEVFKEGGSGPAHPYFSVAKESTYANAFELTKLSAPRHRVKTEKGSLKVNIFADKADLSENMDSAIIIADKLDKDVLIRAHIDNKIVTNVKNPEYEIDKETAERKAIKGLKLRNSLRKASKQGVSTVVFDLIDNPYSISEILGALKRNFKSDSSYPGVKSIIIISKNRKTVKEYSREDIKKG